MTAFRNGGQYGRPRHVVHRCRPARLVDVPGGLLPLRRPAGAARAHSDRRPARRAGSARRRRPDSPTPGAAPGGGDHAAARRLRPDQPLLRWPRGPGSCSIRTAPTRSSSPIALLDAAGAPVAPSPASPRCARRTPRGARRRGLSSTRRCGQRSNRRAWRATASWPPPCSRPATWWRSSALGDAVRDRPRRDHRRPRARSRRRRRPPALLRAARHASTFPQFQQGTPPFDTEGLFDIGADGLPDRAAHRDGARSSSRSPNSRCRTAATRWWCTSTARAGSPRRSSTAGRVTEPGGCPTKGEGPAHVLAAHGFATRRQRAPAQPRAAARRERARLPQLRQPRGVPRHLPPGRDRAAPAISTRSRSSRSIRALLAGCTRPARCPPARPRYHFDPDAGVGARPVDGRHVHQHDRRGRAAHRGGRADRRRRLLELLHPRDHRWSAARCCIAHPARQRQDS